MTTVENLEKPEGSDIRSKYESCDPQYLQDLRQAAGKTVEELARIACLSVAQLRSLESGEHGGFFYSTSIRRHTYRRVLMLLGAEPPAVEAPQALQASHIDLEKNLNDLEQVVAAKKKKITFAERMQVWLDASGRYKYLLGALGLSVAIGVVFLISSPLEVEQLWGKISGQQHRAEPHPKPAASAAEPASSQPVSEAPAQLLTDVQLGAAGVASDIGIAIAKPLAVASASVTAQPETVCAHTTEAMPALKAPAARKEGRFVYMTSPVTTEVCVVDSNKQATLVQIKTGEGRVVWGFPPWQLSGTNLKQVQIYFQGNRISLPAEVSHRVKLIETAVTEQ